MSATLTKTPTTDGLPPAALSTASSTRATAPAPGTAPISRRGGRREEGDAFTRPAKGRHNIAEVALHHAYWAGRSRRS
jgi:hypothetical protein